MMADFFADTPTPPYYAVVFTSLRTSDDDGYDDMARRMAALAAEIPGYLGMESARDSLGRGITVSYWFDLAAIQRWKADVEHLLAQRLGREKWYAAYRTRICRVERAYGFER
ncbi:antibiotic biosynthesis monooxygenase family protein [Paludibacterium purpuratum]|uniref:Heme-degrading monooxygenase HmoA n=1 Tax=Paludibacterium purpuratum TaxID=1144873 RepID=A0A4V3DUQ5_9NEIS|nr:antibiotic biosynthesis monooxygenase [Paludibacterium purpuratum]TDR76487.1 heme-degrading monooxygenase HmoA [Paludibacterium purpuratum]